MFPNHFPADKMLAPVKKFVLKHTFENVSNMEEDDDVYSETEVHFGVPWRLNIEREDGFIELYLNCPKSRKDGKWSIQTEFEFKIVSKTGKVSKTEYLFGTKPEIAGYGFPKFIEWEEMKEDYLTDDKLTLEAHVTILKMTGCGKEKLRSFDEPELSDVVLVVNEKKFYVSKLFLAAQSTYFRSLFLGNFEESNQSEVVLKEIDPDDLHNFLELLYGESVINGSTIDGILLLADMYDSPVAIRRCEEFLLKESNMTKLKKLQISAKYNLEDAKKKCLSEINTVNDIRSAAGVDEMDAATAKELLHKCLSFL